MKKRRILSSLLPAFLLVAPAHAAGQTQDLANLRTKAEQGDADAQSTLAFRYEEGRGVTKDMAEAIKWYTKAGDQGLTEAQDNLCRIHGDNLRLFKGVTPKKGQPLGPIESVKGDEEDINGVKKWCVKSAEKGNAFAKDRLGFLYAKGSEGATPDSEGVKPDYEKACFWLSMGNDNAFFKEVKKQLTR